MREILFRGKSLYNNEWVYGFLLYVDISQGMTSAFQGGYFAIYKHKGGKAVEIDESTIGQYIGVKGYKGDYENRHLNEVRLFEGDIVEAMSNGIKGTFVITFRQEASPCYILYPAWKDGQWWSIHASDTGRVNGDYYDDLKVIGNIYDDKNLIDKLKEK